MSDLFTTMQRQEAADLPITTNDNRVYNIHHYLRDQNDPTKRASFETASLEWQAEGATVRRLYERNEWSEFVPTVFLSGILEHTEYASTASQLASTVTVPSGLTFVYREFEHYQRAQRGAENTEFERKKGLRRTQQVALHTLGARTYATEEELLDLPVDALRLELQTMGASIALERDLLWMDALYAATSGSNSATFHNSIVVNDYLSVEDLHLVLTWFTSPFDAESSTGNVTVTNPFSGSEAAEVEGLMRLGLFRPTDVLVSPRQYWQIVNNATLQAQNIWTNSRILDTGELQVPLLGVNIWKTNIGHFTDPDDADSWVATDDVYVLDRRRGGGGTIGVRQPLQVRNWDTPALRTQDAMIFERVGFAVQNRKSLIRIANGTGS